MSDVSLIEEIVREAALYEILLKTTSYLLTLPSSFILPSALPARFNFGSIS